MFVEPPPTTPLESNRIWNLSASCRPLTWVMQSVCSHFSTLSKPSRSFSYGQESQADNTKTKIQIKSSTTDFCHPRKKPAELKIDRRGLFYFLYSFHNLSSCHYPCHWAESRNILVQGHDLTSEKWPSWLAASWNCPTKLTLRSHPEPWISSEILEYGYEVSFNYIYIKKWNDLSKVGYWAPKKSFVKKCLGTRIKGKDRVWQTAIYGQQETRIQSNLEIRARSQQTLPRNRHHLRLFASVLNNYSDKLLQIGVSTTPKRGV